MIGERKFFIDSQFQKEIYKSVSHNHIITLCLPPPPPPPSWWGLSPMDHPYPSIPSRIAHLFAFIHSFIHSFIKYLFQYEFYYVQGN